RELGAQLGCRITVINADGGVMADNEVDHGMMDNHGDRPEIVDAVNNGVGFSVRKSKSLDTEMLYVAQRTTAPDGKPSYVRLSVHLSKLGHELHVLYATLIGVTVSAIALAAALCYYFASRHTAPVRELA